MSQEEPIYSLPPVFRGPVADVLPLVDEVNWGMKVFGIDKLRTITDGAGIKLGIVDTGIDGEHPLLAPNFVASRDFTGSSSGADDRNGHGTHCSGTVGAADPRIGVCNGAKIYHGKGLGDNGSGGNSIINGLEWCVSEGCEIVSLSLGGGGQSQAWEAVFQRLLDAGIWLIFAGGNSGPNTPNADWPGRSMRVINVAALNSDLSPANFSSAGTKLDTSGPGVNIWSCKPGGGFQQMSGTSMATPFIAGLLGLYRAALKALGMPIPNMYKLREELFARSTDTHTPGDDVRTGPGWLTPMLLSLNLTPDPKPVV